MKERDEKPNEKKKRVGKAGRNWTRVSGCVFCSRLADNMRQVSVRGTWAPPPWPPSVEDSTDLPPVTKPDAGTCSGLRHS